MTPFEKAEELVIKMYDTFTISWEYDNWVIAKICALIAVDEILDAICFNMSDEDAYKKENDYWEEVKKEIEKI